MKIKTSNHFDTLVSVNGSARITFEPWDKFSNYPVGAVTTNHMILAMVHNQGTGEIYPGYIHENDRWENEKKSFAQIIIIIFFKL